MKLYLTTLVFLISILITAQNVQPNAKDETDKGSYSKDFIVKNNIRSIEYKEDCFFTKKGKDYKVDSCEEKTIEEFDRNGNLTATKYYDEDGDLYLKLLSSYSKSGLLYKYQVIDAESNEEEETILFKYNDNNKLIQTQFFANGIYDHEINYEYNTMDLVSKKEYTNPNSRSPFGNDKTFEKYYVVYTYDQKDRLVKEVKYDINDTMEEQYIYSYTKDGLSSTTRRRNIGEQFSKVDYITINEKVFDRSSNRIKETTYDPYEGVLRKELIYDFNDKNVEIKIESKDYSKGYLNKTVETYNSQSEITSKTYFNRTTKTTSYKYLGSDKKGNWIYKIKLDDGETIEDSEFLEGDYREIKYY
jgi:hypothetical protein